MDHDFERYTTHQGHNSVNLITNNTVIYRNQIVALAGKAGEGNSWSHIHFQFGHGVEPTSAFQDLYNLEDTENHWIRYNNPYEDDG